MNKPAIALVLFALISCHPSTRTYRIGYANQAIVCSLDPDDIDIAFAAAADAAGLDAPPMARVHNWFVHILPPPLLYGESRYHGLSWGGSVSVECPPAILQGALAHEFLHGMLFFERGDGDAEHEDSCWDDLELE